MSFSFDGAVTGLYIVAAIATITVAIPIWSQAVRDMRGRKTVQTALLAIIALALAVSAADRLGILWPSPSEVAASLKKSQNFSAKQAQIIDELRGQITGTVPQTRTSDADGTREHPYTDPRLCPANSSLIIANGRSENGHAVLSAPAGQKGICYVGNETKDVDTGIELRDPPRK